MAKLCYMALQKWMTNETMKETCLNFVAIMVPLDDLVPLYTLKWHEHEFKLTNFGCCIMISTWVVQTDQQCQAEGVQLMFERSYFIKFLEGICQCDGYFDKVSPLKGEMVEKSQMTGWQLEGVHSINALTSIYQNIKIQLNCCVVV